MPAVIRVAGDRRLLTDVVAASGLPFTESAQYQRRRRLYADACEMETTYNLTVSEADGDSVPTQVTAVDAFFDANEQRIDNLLRSIPGCRCTIDFSWDFPTTSAGQYTIFPAALLSRLGTLGIELVVSLYATSENAANHPMQVRTGNGLETNGRESRLRNC